MTPTQEVAVKQYGWKAIVVWPNGEITRSLRLTTGLLKEFLDREVFCLDHGCPLPVLLTIERVSR